MSSKALTKALVTGYGGGKTFCMVQEGIKHSFLDPGIPHMLVSPTYPMAEQTIIPTIIEILEDYFEPSLQEGRDYFYNRSKHNFYIKKWNGIIWVRSADKPSSLKGPNLGSFGIDEPGLIKDSNVYKIMISRRRHPRAKYPQGYLSGTPEGLNWFFDLCEGDKIPKDFCLVKGKTTDNTHLSIDYINDLYDQYDEQLVQAYINGEFVNLEGGSAYYSFSNSLYPKGNLIDDFEINPSRPLVLGMDFNYNPMTLVIGQEVMVNKEVKFIVFDELFRKNCDTDMAIEQVLEKYGKYKFNVYPDMSAYSDSAHGSAKSDITLIKNTFERYKKRPINDYIIKGKSANPPRKDRLNSVNTLLRNAKGEIKLLIQKKCKFLLEDLKKCLMEEYINGRYVDPERGHITDALGYAVHARYPVRIDRYYNNLIIH